MHLGHRGGIWEFIGGVSVSYDHKKKMCLVTGKERKLACIPAFEGGQVEFMYKVDHKKQVRNGLTKVFSGSISREDV